MRFDQRALVLGRLKGTSFGRRAQLRTGRSRAFPASMASRASDLRLRSRYWLSVFSEVRQRGHELEFSRVGVPYVSELEMSEELRSCVRRLRAFDCLS